MRIGITILPQTRWRDQADLWRRAEDYGFDHAWTYDHLTWDPLDDEPWGATVPTLVAAATVTRRIELGPWVASPNYRHPVPFARDIAGLDDVSQGRAVVAVGAGTPQRDGRVLGSGAAGGADLSPGDRAGRLEEFVALLDLALREGPTSFEGRFYQAVEATTRLPEPQQLPRPPIVVAANGPRLIRLAARYDGWATLGVRGGGDDDAWWAGLRDLVGKYEAAVAETAVTETAAPGGAVETSPGPHRRILNLDSAPTFSLSSAQHFVDVVGRAGELGFTDVVTHWPRKDRIYAGSESVLEEVAGLLPGLRA